VVGSIVVVWLLRQRAPVDYAGDPNWLGAALVMTAMERNETLPDSLDDPALRSNLAPRLAREVATTYVFLAGGERLSEINKDRVIAYDARSLGPGTYVLTGDGRVLWVRTPMSTWQGSMRPRGPGGPSSWAMAV
jgi:hypothetical protein